MEFGLLGPLEIHGSDGGPVRIGGHKQRAFLTLLLLNANRVVDKERLVEGIWGEHPPASAAKLVHVYVSRLRKLLPEGALLTRPPGYLLRVEPLALDVARVERFLEEARACEDAKASKLLREAVALWRGAPLAEFAEEPFARVEAARLGDLRLAVLEGAFEAELALGRDAELVGEIELLIAEHPHRERLRAQLMLALYRSGRQAEALAAYRDARAALVEIGVEPSPALRQLERQILTQDAALEIRFGARLTSAAGGETPLPGPLILESPFPFVGRVAELDRLRELLDRAIDGVGAVVALAGEAGSGKTRLVRELAHEAAGRGVLTLYGTSDGSLVTPYQPLREWLEFLLRVCDPEMLAGTLGAGAGALARLVPELARVSTGAPDPQPAIDRYVLQSAVTEFVVRMTRRQPLVLVLDDLHWADGETLHLLRRLARLAPETRMLVVAPYRDVGEESRTEVGETIADVARLEATTRLRLGNLNADEVSEFIRRLVRAEPRTEVTSAIADLTDGTPLLLCELWRDLLASDVVEISDVVRLTRPTAELRGPELVRNIVQQRLSRLGPDTIAVLELAAAAGPRFDLPVLSEALRFERDRLVNAVDETIRNGIIEELPEPATYRFAHELVRRAIYDRLTGVRRAEAHLRVGEALERAHGANAVRFLPELAYHFRLAAPLGGAERAVDYNLRAADAALAAAAYDDAAELYSNALELGIADAAEQARVQVELAYILHNAGRLVEAKTLLDSISDATDAPKQRAAAARASFMRSGSPMGDPRIDPEQLRQTAESAFEACRDMGDARGRALTGRFLAMALRREGRLAAACTVAELALADADASGDRDARRQLSGTLAFALCDGPTPVDEAVMRCGELLQAGQGDLKLETIVGDCLGSLHAMGGRRGDALDRIRRTSDARNEPTRSDLAVYRWAIAETMEFTGDHAGACRELKAKWNWFVDFGEYTPDARAMQAAYQLALLHCDAGRWRDAEQCLDYGREVPVRSVFVHEGVLRLAASARVAAHRGGLDAAMTSAARAVELAETSDFLNLRARAWLALAEVERVNVRGTEADAAVARALALYEQKGNVAAVSRLRGAAGTATWAVASTRHPAG